MSEYNLLYTYIIILYINIFILFKTLLKIQWPHGVLIYKYLF